MIGAGVVHNYGTAQSAAGSITEVSVLGQQVVAWTGFLFDRKTAYRRLKDPPGPQATLSDARLVLALCHELQGRAWTLLDGEYSFIFGDALAGSLLLVSDALGTRPIYYAENSGGFVVASDELALLEGTKRPGSVNIDRMLSGVLPWWQPMESDSGWVVGHRRLEPGTYLRLEQSGRRWKKRYWSIPDLTPRQRQTQTSEVEGLRDVLCVAVRSRLEVVHRAGLMQSGGIDSACVASAVKAESTTPGKQVVSLSVVEDETADSPESQAIRAINRVTRFDTRQIVLPLDMDSPAIREYLQRLRDYPHPFAWSISVFSLLAPIARDSGCSLVLHGAAGDLVSDAPDTYWWDVLKDRGVAQGLAELRSAIKNHVYLRGMGAHEVILRAVWQRLVPARLRPIVRPATYRGEMGRALLLAHSQIHDVRARARRMLRMRDEQLAQDWRASRLAVLSSDSTLWGRDAISHVGAANGALFTDVFLDRRVVEWFVAAPLTSRVAGGWTKSAMRDYVEATMGPAVARRKDKDHVGAHLDTLRRAVATSLSATSLSLPTVLQACGNTLPLELQLWAARLGEQQFDT